MRTIEIRNVPERTHRELCARAAAVGLSLSDFALKELKRTTMRPTVAEVLRRAGSRPGGLSTESIVATVREGRDRN